MLVCHSSSQKEGRTEMEVIFIALWLVAFVAFVKCERHLKSIADAPKARGTTRELYFRRRLERAEGPWLQLQQTRCRRLLGARGCPNRNLLKTDKCFRIMVSAAGFEPATHALKGHPTALALVPMNVQEWR